jgi:hypothetical protein
MKEMQSISIPWVTSEELFIHRTIYNNLMKSNYFLKGEDEKEQTIAKSFPEVPW